MKKRPKVGIAVAIVKNNQVLLGKRLGKHGPGTWAYPGGHLEFMESWEECARRETKEETSLEIKNVRFGVVTNELHYQENEHYITIGMIADYAGGEPQTLESNKCEEWCWFSWDNLPQPLFLPIVNQLKLGFNPCSL